MVVSTAIAEAHLVAACSRRPVTKSSAITWAAHEAMGRYPSAPRQYETWDSSLRRQGVNVAGALRILQDLVDRGVVLAIKGRDLQKYGFAIRTVPSHTYFVTAERAAERQAAAQREAAEQAKAARERYALAEARRIVLDRHSSEVRMEMEAILAKSFVEA